MFFVTACDDLEILPRINQNGTHIDQGYVLLRVKRNSNTR